MDKADLQEQKIALLRSIRAEADRMVELVEQDAFEELARCLEIRQGYMDRIDEMDRDLEACGTAPALSSDQRTQVDALLGDIRVADERTAGVIREALTAARSGIREVNISRNILEAYSPFSAPNKHPTTKE